MPAVAAAKPTAVMAIPQGPEERRNEQRGYNTDMFTHNVTSRLKCLRGSCTGGYEGQPSTPSKLPVLLTFSNSSSFVMNRRCSQAAELSSSLGISSSLNFLMYMWALADLPNKTEVRVGGGSASQNKVTSYTQGIDLDSRFATVKLQPLLLGTRQCFNTGRLRDSENSFPAWYFSGVYLVPSGKRRTQTGSG